MFVIVAGSIIGSFIVARLLGIMPDAPLLLLLAIILFVSAYTV